MSDDFPQKCVFRCEKKEFFEALKKEQDFIGNNLYKYLDENSHELFEKYQVNESMYSHYDEDNSKLIIKEANGKIEAEICYIYINTPAPEAAYCLAETIARKAGIDITEVQVYIYFWWVSYQFVITNDPQMKNKLLVGFTGDDAEDNKIIFGESKLTPVDEDYENDAELAPQNYNEPSELLAKIKAIIKDENLQGYENLGKDYIFDDTDHDEWCCISDWYDWNDNPPNEEVLAILDFTERYNRQEESKQNSNGETLKITPIFFTYSESIPTENPAIQSLLNLPANSAAKQKYALEQIELAKEYYRGEEKEKAEKLFKEYVEDGYDMKTIGDFYSEEENFEKAFEWYSQAVENDSTSAAFEIGKLYYQGQGCTQDKAKAEECFDIAVSEEYIWEIVDFYYDNEDYEKSIKYLKLIDENLINDDSNDYNKFDLRHAQFLIGLFYTKESVVQDFTKAIEYFKLALNKGISIAAMELGKIFYEGKGVKQDKKQAEEWFEYAINDDCESEKEFLKEYDYDEFINEYDYYGFLEKYDYYGYFNEIPELYYKNGELKKACEWYEKIVDNDVFGSDEIIDNFENDDKFCLELCKLFAAKGDEYAKEKLEELKKKTK